MQTIKQQLATRVWDKKLGPVEEGEFRTLFTLNPRPMWVYDVRTFRILDVNEAALEQYGYTRDEFLGLTIRDIRPKEDLPKFLELTRQLPYSDRTGPWRHLLRDGTVIQVLITSHSVKLGDVDARLVMAENIAEDPDLDLM
ncbi:MAG TPA: PAS domain S-box protein [Candidatus Dormibacteraeota bacterium]|nr:PAS domain S-box protein [Candidatus Dormibacteraeota bacterium]